MYDVLTVGHVLVDLRFLVDRFPGPDEEARILDERRGVGGSAANVAIGVSRLGMRSCVIAKVGLDAFGRIAVDELMRERVDIAGIRVSPTSSTGFSVVVRDSSGRIIIYGYKGASEELEPRDIDRTLVERSRAVHISSLRLDTTIHVAQLAKELGKLVTWDPGRVLSMMGFERLRKVIELVDIVFANRREIANIAEVEDYRKAAEIVKELGPRIVVVKRGAEGVYVLSDEGVLDLPAVPAPRVVDTTGAGDAFAAGFLVAMLRGYDLRRAVLYASTVAALKVSKLGSYEVPRHEEVVEYGRRFGLNI